MATRLIQPGHAAASARPGHATKSASPRGRGLVAVWLLFLCRSSQNGAHHMLSKAEREAQAAVDEAWRLHQPMDSTNRAKHRLPKIHRMSAFQKRELYDQYISNRAERMLVKYVYVLCTHV